MLQDVREPVFSDISRTRPVQALGIVRPGRRPASSTPATAKISRPQPSASRRRPQASRPEKTR